MLDERGTIHRDARSCAVVGDPLPICVPADQLLAVIGECVTANDAQALIERRGFAEIERARAGSVALYVRAAMRFSAAPLSHAREFFVAYSDQYIQNVVAEAASRLNSRSTISSTTTPRSLPRRPGWFV